MDIDTCHLKFPIELPNRMLGLPWTKRTSQRVDRSIKVWYLRVEHFNSARIRMVYFPMSFDGKPLLVIQISSIPKLINGSNIIHLHSVEETIEPVNALLAQILMGTNIDIGSGVLERIDFYHDYLVGDLIAEYILAISQLSYPHRTRCIFQNPSGSKTRRTDNGVWFKSNGAICKFYDKGLESGDMRAYGFLRHECELRDTDKIASATGLLVPTLREINPLIVFNVLKRDLVRLGLWQSNITGENSSLEMLLLRYKPRQAKRLSNIIRDIHDHPGMSKAELAIRLGIHVQALNKSLREIKDAGIAVGTVEGEIILPPLELRMDEDREYEIVTKGASDTEMPISLVTPDEIRLLK